MGLFKDMKNAAGAAQAMQADAMQQMAANQGMMNQMMGDQSEMAAYAQLANKLASSGVEAPGVIHSIAPGQPDFAGNVMTSFEVSIRPATGDLFQTTIKQSMLPAQLGELAEGKAVTVRYDPDAPQMALLYGW